MTVSEELRILVSQSFDTLCSLSTAFQTFYFPWCIMFAFLILFFTLTPFPASSYNVDTSRPIVYEDQDPGGNGYFGYTVALRSYQHPTASASIFIGAPKYNKGEGALYRCSVNVNETSSNSCRRLELDQASISEDIRVQGSEYLKITRFGTVGWLGASLATRENSDLTVCAPRTSFKHTTNDSDFESSTAELLHDMRGICYNLPDAIGDTLYRDNSVLLPGEYLSQKSNINALYGFSINYAAKKDLNTVELIIGRPRWSKVDIHHENKTETRVYPGLGAGDFDEALANAAVGANLGYSVTSGYIFHPKELVFAAGTPALKKTGQVVVYLPGTAWETKIDGSVLGEYFGASLTTGDFDNDGLDDIAVGAPHWGEVDYGRVYTYYGNNKGVFREGLMLQGTAEYGQFGYTVAAGDLDNDGHADLVVGAPWEASGTVYVFYGQREFGTKGAFTPITQRIASSDFKGFSLIQGFGFSLAIPVDVDKNGYPDLAVGAYKSGHAVVLRGKPVVKVAPLLVSYTPILERSARSFVIRICAEYQGKKAPEFQEFRVEIAADEEYMRIENDESVKFFTAPFTRDEISCVNKTLHLRRSSKNFVEPIVIRGRFSISKKSKEGDKFCSRCPVLNKGHLLEEAVLLIPFNTGCKDGKVCNSNLSISWNATGVGNNDQWAVGSGDVSIDILVTNNGEPAFRTNITIKMPPGVGLRKGIPSCLETKERNCVILECDVGNPLSKGDPKSLAVDLDMEGTASSAGGTILPFTVTTKTLSVNHGQNESVFYLRLENRAHITLMGVANEQNHKYEKKGNNSKLSIRHTYQLIKIGPSSLPKVHFAVDVPVAITEKNVSIVDIHLPELDSSGNMHECLIVDTATYKKTILPNLLHSLRLTKTRGAPELSVEEKVEEPEVDAKDEEEIHHGERKNGTLLEGKTSIDGQGTDRTIYVNCSTAGITCHTVMCDFNISKTSGDAENSILDMMFDVQPLFTSAESFFLVNFSTDARALIVKPTSLVTMNGSRFVEAKASTILYQLPKTQKLAGWVLPVSLCLGLLILVLLIIILSKVGFFTRPKKIRIGKANGMTLSLKVDDSYSDLDLPE
ncbi:integrin alpha-8-like isoform X1 [Neodiprion lecontei]|uniref:Integrin alpha-8-like isoform X1 n=1 Tax=Neodiprion lecontei TaxID=441921 RepID=A0ABM3G9Y0_NEOLC|nr:integrin alpha-8-like isoform X1 [Neodiprion lecontei]